MTMILKNDWTLNELEQYFSKKLVPNQTLGEKL